MTARILIIDDARDSRLPLIDLFNYHGYKVLEARDGREGIEMAVTKQPDVIVLDWLMPRGLGGLEVLHSLRSNAKTEAIPIVIFSNIGSDISLNLLATRNGANGFLPKALDGVFNIPQEDGLDMLEAKVVQILQHEGAVKRKIQHGSGFFHVDAQHLVAVAGNKRITNLTPKEFDLFKLLITYHGEVISKSSIVEELYPYENYPEGVEDSRVEALVKRLRHKIEEDPHHPQYLITRNGFGYQMVEPKEDH
jgi:two-component system OmpR family response regulator/two-component system alkaline phosphatase synthesis response regulator PhoP